jgi:adenylate cyclase
VDYTAEGLLDGLQGTERAARVSLLDRLVADGASAQELRRALAEDRLVLLPVERRLGGRYTAAEAERASGVPAAILLRVRRLLGLPDAGAQDRVFGEEDIAQAQSLKLFLQSGFSQETLAELTRVLGESMSRVATAATAGFAETFLRPGDSELELAERFDQLAERLTPALEQVLIGSFNAHLREAIHRGMIGRLERETGRPAPVQQIAICFVDLVGFTRLGGELEVRELGSVASRLAALALDAVVAPARLVKTIGDAAMFVAPQPEPLIGTALALIERAEAADLPALRAGVAFGPAAQRAGDFYGHSVNVASRVTGVARPGSVLCTEDVREMALSHYAFSYAGRFRLKGVGDSMPLHRAHLRDAQESDEAPRRRLTSTRPAGRSRRRASR